MKKFLLLCLAAPSLVFAQQAEESKFKLGGDFRLRYQMDKREGFMARHRFRYRIRGGVDAKVTEKLTASIGLTSGSGDPRSTNQTMQKNFEFPQVRFDYAYITHKANDLISVYAGKIKGKNALWTASDFFWDHDINPEGINVAVKADTLGKVKFFSNTGLYVLNEASGRSSSIMYVVQPGMEAGLGSGVNLKTAIGFYALGHARGTLFDYTASSNSADADGRLLDKYTNFVPSLELSVKDPVEKYLPYASIFIEAIKNTEICKNSGGAIAGIKLGESKVNDAKQWQFAYSYKYLERNSVLDIFPDSDFRNGKTDAKGHEIILAYGIDRDIVLAADYYNTKGILSGRKTEHLLQIDLSAKF